MDAAAALLARPRLEDALCRGFTTTRITVIVAPAGSGKTALMARLRAICAARGDHVLGHDGNLAAALTGEAGCSAIIFVDDADGFDAAVLRGLVEDVLGRDDSRVHLVLAARALPQVDLARPRLHGLVADCDAARLAFTATEAAEFLCVPPGLLNETRLREIVHRTEGWAAGLRIIARQLAAGADLGAVAEGFSGADVEVRGYIEETLFRDLPAGLRGFISAIAGLERFCPELAATVTGSAEAEAYCAEIIRRNLFWIALDRQQHWGRLHRVFREFVIATDRGASPMLSAQRLSRAALWHERHGNWIEAVNYALAAGDNGRAARWLRDCGAEMLTTRGETVAFLDCCARLPEAALRDPELIIWMVWAAVFSASSTVAASLMTRHVTILEAARQAADRVQLIRILLAFFSYDFRNAILLGAAWMKVPGHGNAFDRATVAAMMAMALRTQLRAGEALGWLATARRELAPLQSPYGAAWIETIDAYLALGQGRASWACEVLERLLASLPSAALIRGTAELVLADAYYECGRLAEAGGLVVRSLATLEHHGAADFAYCGWRTAALVAVRARGPRQALLLLREGEPVAVRRYGNREVLMLRLLQGELLAGLTDEARNLLAAQGITAPPLTGEAGEWCPELSERRRLLAAKRNVIAGDPRAALRELQSVLAGARSEGRLRVWADASCVKAAALAADGENLPAVRSLIDCVQKVARLGLRRTIVDNAVLLRPLGPLLAEYRRGGQTEDDEVLTVVDQLLQAMDIRICGASEAADAVVPPVALTAKERMILVRVAEGLTNAQICERLVLALPTVRWHLHNIFGKLEVSNRMAAVNKARLFGLLG